MPPTPTVLSEGPTNNNDGCSPRVPPTSPPNRMKRIQSEPLRIKTDHQSEDVLITQREREETSNQRINEQRVLEKYEDTVKTPDEILHGIHIHRDNKICTVYIKDFEDYDCNRERRAVIADAKTGRASLGSTITEQEYSKLKKTGEIDLSDLRRDPETLVMNRKSVEEAAVLTRANDEGYLKKFNDIRRPHKVSESRTDFVGKDSNGSKVNFDIKMLHDPTKRPFSTQTKDINTGIKELFSDFDEIGPTQIICDITEAPAHLQASLMKKITEGLNSSQLKNITFIY